MKKTITIIGGCGFLENHITRKFLSDGHTVKVSIPDDSQQVTYYHLLGLSPDTVFSKIQRQNNIKVSNLKSGSRK
jgi:nucleoside-diphosphate-sugar epimerase